MLAARPKIHYWVIAWATHLICRGPEVLDKRKIDQKVPWSRMTSYKSISIIFVKLKMNKNCFPNEQWCCKS